MSDFSGLYNIRDAAELDKNFIRASFLNGTYYGIAAFNKIPKDIFMKNYKEVIEHLLTQGNVKVACLPDEPNVILGYSVLSPDYQVVHWVYVKKDWRKHGIAKRLLPQFPTAVTHLTELGETLLPKLSNPVYNPFLI